MTLVNRTQREIKREICQSAFNLKVSSLVSKGEALELSAIQRAYRMDGRFKRLVWSTNCRSSAGPECPLEGSPFFYSLQCGRSPDANQWVEPIEER